MDDKLWTPMHAPSTMKRDGGSWFDDELETKEEHAQRLAADAKELMGHLNQRPDHNVYVADLKMRSELREVFNWWLKEGAIIRHPNIRINHRMPMGAVEVGP